MPTAQDQWVLTLHQVPKFSCVSAWLIKVPLLRHWSKRQRRRVFRHCDLSLLLNALMKLLSVGLGKARGVPHDFVGISPQAESTRDKFAATVDPHRTISNFIRSGRDHSSFPLIHIVLSEERHQTETCPNWSTGCVPFESETLDVFPPWKL